ncbi:hypothetical protein EDD90_7245 [Streptomyces sp. Ag109_O5-1]|uniref:hypothetical protein n=1 Tax=Streptomyces TaxID=1883 RepID=UPI000FB8C8E9|nr:MULTISPECIES: hypothetical protein [Streptomyces]RPE44022.1 hypothetical protein EDD90_7245 [Streptomyces sp. Ag109_O5-1]
MGALRRIWRRPRAARVAAVAGLAAVGVGGMAACQPSDLNTATVAYTTDQTATAELKRQHVDVSWLTCTGNYGSSAKATKTAQATRTPSPSGTTVVSVDCKGKTKDGRAITVTGRVTKAVSGACVRGDLVAKVGGKEWFHVKGLGNCDATPGPSYSYRPPTYGRQPGPTVTVTKTIWCQGDPKCWPVQGK